MFFSQSKRKSDVFGNEMRNEYKILVENLKGTDSLEDISIDGKIILEWILGMWVGRCELDLSDSG
jgi:hypothetical protein